MLTRPGVQLASGCPSNQGRGGSGDSENVPIKQPDWAATPLWQKQSLSLNRLQSDSGRCNSLIILIKKTHTHTAFYHHLANSVNLCSAIYYPRFVCYFNILRGVMDTPLCFCLDGYNCHRTLFDRKVYCKQNPARHGFRSTLKPVYQPSPPYYWIHGGHRRAPTVLLLNISI